MDRKRDTMNRVRGMSMDLQAKRRTQVHSVWFGVSGHALLMGTALATILACADPALGQSVITSGNVSPVHTPNPSPNWTIDGSDQLIIGNGGTGGLSIIGGGWVEVDTTSATQIGRNTGGDGSVLISGTGSAMRVLDGGLNLGFGGTGEIEVTDGGHLAVEGSLDASGGSLIVVTPIDGLRIGKDGGTATLTVSDGTVSALLHKASDVRGSPFPGRIYPAVSVTGIPSAV